MTLHLKTTLCSRCWVFRQQMFVEGQYVLISLCAYCIAGVNPSLPAVSKQWHSYDVDQAGSCCCCMGCTELLVITGCPTLCCVCRVPLVLVFETIFRIMLCGHAHYENSFWKPPSIVKTSKWITVFTINTVLHMWNHKQVASTRHLLG